MSVVKFPERITRTKPTEQFEQIRHMKVRQMLAAVIRQVGPISFTADDLAKENEWGNQAGRRSAMTTTRTIVTTEDLEALPAGSIIRDAKGTAWQKYRRPISSNPAWFPATRDTGFYLSRDFVADNRTPAMVLHEEVSSDD